MHVATSRPVVAATDSGGARARSPIWSTKCLGCIARAVHEEKPKWTPSVGRDDVAPVGWRVRCGSATPRFSSPLLCLPPHHRSSAVPDRQLFCFLLAALFEPFLLSSQLVSSTISTASSVLLSTHPPIHPSTHPPIQRLVPYLNLCLSPSRPSFQVSHSLLAASPLTALARPYCSHHAGPSCPRFSSRRRLTSLSTSHHHHFCRFKRECLRSRCFP